VGAWVVEWLAEPLTPDARVERGVRALRRVALAVLAVAMALRLVMQARSFVDPGGSVVAMMWTVATQTTWGRGWLAQGAALLLCLAPLRGAPGIVPSALLSATPALMGHAVATERYAVLAVGTDWLHVAASGAWIGSVAVLVLAVMPAPGWKASGLFALVTRFSPIALASATLIGVSGTVSAWLHLPDVPSLWSSVYGRLILLKLGLFFLIAAFGAVSWRRATPRLAAGDASMLVRSARAEVLIALLVVMVTAVLTATPFPGE